MELGLIRVKEFCWFRVADEGLGCRGLRGKFRVGVTSMDLY